MIFTWVILILLALGVFSGYRRGFVAVLMSLIAYIVAWLVAMLLSQPVAQFLYQTFSSNHDSTILVPHLLSGLVFLVLFSVVYGIVRRIGRSLNLITKLPVIHLANALLGAAINFVVRYLLIFLTLNILLLFPSEWIHSQYANSQISQSIVKDTPIMSKQIIQNWQDRQVN